MSNDGRVKMVKNCSNCRNAEHKGREDGNVYCHFWGGVHAPYTFCGYYSELQNDPDDNILDRIDDILKKFEELDKELAELKEKIKNGGGKKV